MTVDEKVLLDRSTEVFSAASASSTIPEEFSGKQIILNSDSVVLNSRDGTLVGMAKNGIGFFVTKFGSLSKLVFRDVEKMS